MESAPTDPPATPEEPTVAPAANVVDLIDYGVMYVPKGENETMHLPGQTIIDRHTDVIVTHRSPKK